MNALLTIVKSSMDQHAKLPQMELCWQSMSVDQRLDLLRDDDYTLFCSVCRQGYMEISQWLFSVCPEDECFLMLKAQNYAAFRWACHDGCQALAEWLLSLCHNEQGYVAMCRADNDDALRWACENERDSTVKWLLNIYSDRLAIDVIDQVLMSFQGLLVSWPYLNVDQQIKLFRSGLGLDLLLNDIQSKADLDFYYFQSCLVEHAQSRQVSSSITHYLFVEHALIVIKSLIISDYSVKDAWQYGQISQYYDNEKLSAEILPFVMDVAIQLNKKEWVNHLLGVIHPLALLNAPLLLRWIQTSRSSDCHTFAHDYQTAVWRQPLYDALERGLNDDEYSSLTEVIRVLFEQHCFTLESLVESIIKNNQSGDQRYWVSLCQEVVIAMVDQKGGLTPNDQQLWESFCRYPLEDMNSLEGMERLFKIIGWFEHELIKHDDSGVIWSRHHLWQMIQSLGFGVGILYKDTHEECMRKLQLKKESLSCDYASVQDVDLIMEAGFFQSSSRASEYHTGTESLDESSASKCLNAS